MTTPSASSTTRVSAWKQVSNWRQRQVAHSEKFQAAAQNFATSIANAVTGQQQGMVTITAQRATERVQAASTQKLQALRASSSALNVTA